MLWTVFHCFCGKSSYFWIHEGSSSTSVLGHPQSPSSYSAVLESLKNFQKDGRETQTALHSRKRQNGIYPLVTCSSWSWGLFYPACCKPTAHNSASALAGISKWSSNNSIREWAMIDPSNRFFTRWMGWYTRRWKNQSIQRIFFSLGRQGSLSFLFRNRFFKVLERLWVSEFNALEVQKKKKSESWYSKYQFWKGWYTRLDNEIRIQEGD